MDVTRTGEAEVRVLLLFEDVEEGVEKAIVFFCLQETHRGLAIKRRRRGGIQIEKRVRAFGMYEPWVGRASRRRMSEEP